MENLWYEDLVYGEITTSRRINETIRLYRKLSLLRKGGGGLRGWYGDKILDVSVFSSKIGLDLKSTFLSMILRDIYENVICSEV